MRSAPENSTILAFGDSLTYGFGTRRPEEESYPAVLAKLTGQKVVNAGVNGETTEEGLQRIDELLRRIHPGVTVLCLGGNDLLQGMPRTHIRENLKRLIEKIRASGSQMLLVAVPDFALLGLRALPLYNSLAEEFDLPLESDALPEILAEPRLKSDSIHPNAQGYRKMAEAIAASLKKAGMLKEKEK